MAAPSHFRIAGIPIRVEPVFFVIAALFGLRYADTAIWLLFAWVGVTFVSILVHELGHGLALKVFGRPSAIVLHGFGGVTISHGRTGMSKARSVVVSLAGSITALVVLWLPARTALGSDWGRDQLFDYVLSDYGFSWWPILRFTAFANLWWSIANLLPIRPLDGGNVTAELFGLHRARRISIGAAIAAAVLALTQGETWAAFFALFLAFNNYQEIRAEQSGHDVDAFEVEAPEAGGARGRPRRRGPHLRPVPEPGGAGAPGAVGLEPVDPARAAQRAWAALRAGDGAAAARALRPVDPRALNPFLRAATALATGDRGAFELYEAAYVAQPAGPPNLTATEVLARSGAAEVVARRLVDRPDRKGLEGAANLQTHLHYAEHYREAAEVGEVVHAAGPASPAQTAFEVACSWARAGEVDRAAAWLSRAADAGFRAASIVDGEPDLAPLRALPAWPELRARLV